MSQREFLDGACKHCGGGGSIRLVNPAWLRDRRTAARWTLREVGAALDVSAVYICDIEHGRRAVPDYVHEFYRGLEPQKLRTVR